MGSPVLYQEAMLFWGVLYTCPKKLESIREILETRYGVIFYEVYGFPFTASSYYNQEMGEGLLKSFFFFDTLIPPETIADIKLLSNSIEDSFVINGKRTINCDPGYLDMAKVILPTTKDRDHRIYLRDGIFAEVTLHYRGQSYEGFPWTYPDFATPDYIELFNAMRGVFAEKRSRKTLRATRVISAYRTKFKNPIILKTGDVVVVGEEEKEKKWHGWIWVENNISQGWAPIQILEIDHVLKNAVVKEDYFAKELDVNEGDLVEKKQSMNGWTWVKNIKTLNEGWIPDEIIE